MAQAGTARAACSPSSERSAARKEWKILEEAFAIGGQTRRDVILVHVTNPASTPVTVHPRIVVNTTRALRSTRRLKKRPSIITIP